MIYYGFHSTSATLGPSKSWNCKVQMLCPISNLPGLKTSPEEDIDGI